jgi:phosphorylase/glycogen(starch) synthase
MTGIKEDPTTPKEYLFETSWEVCNKVGGIYTVIYTKALSLVNVYHDNYILIGPDVWKETHENPDFHEDKFLHKAWSQKAESEGLKIKVGRWNMPCQPVVILIDFTTSFAQKDKIFAWLWETYKLDSLNGGWDYMEPALFGYAAAKVIESFYNYYVSYNEKIVAQFHEWMTGVGVLYLKNKVPQVGTVFTTHATVVGRSVAGNGLPLYRNIDIYDGDGMALQFGVTSKQSLEKLSAANADAFTTVSQITNNECRQFLQKQVDVLTPNGFEDSFVPAREEYYEKRAKSREKIFQVAEGLLNQSLPKDSILIITSGRYEFRNKGIDLFIDLLGRLNKQERLQRDIIAILTIPAYQFGPRPELLDRMAKPDFSIPLNDEYLTHGLHEPENDAILRRIRKNELHNAPGDKVKVIFVPAYLNGEDGIFNLDYYDFLVGFDGSIFPSYYEPWGYTPLESLAFHIPTITTSLAGFGQWVKSLYPTIKDSVTVIPRGDDNDEFVVEEMMKAVLQVISKSEKEILKIRMKAFEVSRSALWKNLINHYYTAFDLATSKADSRFEFYKGKQAIIQTLPVKGVIETKPEWKKVLVQQNLPENLLSLDRIANNLWWTWNSEGYDLFEMVDKIRWEEMKHNPIPLIESLNYQELQVLSKNEAFVNKLKKLTERFDDYMSKTIEKPVKQVAYFSMEFGLHDTVKIFSGGLGILAGDYLKQASDSNYNIIGIGLLYRYGYFQQQISISGEQIATYTPQKFTHLPLQPVRDENNNWLKITFALPGRTMYAKIWRVDVGRVPLYLLDSDIDENVEADRMITHQLYGGDLENRLRQEILLGIGGIRMLNLLGMKPDIYHSNEGHSAFIGIERLRNIIQNDKLTFNQALEVVRASTLFTTHTPVPAGHDRFTENLMRRYLSHYPENLNIKWEEFMNLGKMIPGETEEFSMSILAAKLSQEINAVSRIHCNVTREMFADLYPGYYPKELHIGFVTNGVHYPTWSARAWQELYKKHFPNGFEDDQSNPELWKKIQDVDDAVIWKIRQEQKKKLADYLNIRMFDEMTRRNENPKLIFKMREASRNDALTIGFARRFATYKRAHLLFSNPDRLSKIVNNTRMPVRFIFAGKAHPKDKAGQDLIKTIYEMSKTPEFLGKIFFVENYDIELAQYLVSGVDIWLNTPTRPLEASGTSGEKAVMNGVVNFSVLDGWWAEGYKPDAGWALKEDATYKDSHFQDDLDAETIYTMLEEEIIPLFYDVNSKKVPERWISYIKNTISEIAPHFTMKRQLDDYITKYYNPLFERSAKMLTGNFELARHLASWKRHVLREWDNIHVISLNLPDSTQKPLILGESFRAEIVLDLAELSPEDIGIEILFGRKVNDEIKEPLFESRMTLTKADRNIATYNSDIPFNQAGVYDFTLRLFPVNSELPHRQDFSIVKWI